MFEVHCADKQAGKFPLPSMGGSADGLACADPGARTPIDGSGNFLSGQVYNAIVVNPSVKFIRSPLDLFIQPWFD